MPDARPLFPLIVNRRGERPVIDLDPIPAGNRRAFIAGAKCPLRLFGRRDEPRPKLAPRLVAIDHRPTAFRIASSIESASGLLAGTPMTRPSSARRSMAGGFTPAACR